MTGAPRRLGLGKAYAAFNPKLAAGAGVGGGTSPFAAAALSGATTWYREKCGVAALTCLRFVSTTEVKVCQVSI